MGFASAQPILRGLQVVGCGSCLTATYRATGAAKESVEKQLHECRKTLHFRKARQGKARQGIEFMSIILLA